MPKTIFVDKKNTKKGVEKSNKTSSIKIRLNCISHKANLPIINHQTSGSSHPTMMGALELNRKLNLKISISFFFLY